MKIFAFDAETDGLWGGIFAIGAVVMEDGKVTQQFYGSYPANIKSDWAKGNVLPSLPASTHNTYFSMLSAFAEFYNAHREGATQVVHMGYIVEAHLLREMFDFNLIGEWDGPFPLHDLATALECAKQDETSQDKFFQDNGGMPSGAPTPVAFGQIMDSLPGKGQVHHPTFDAYVTAWCWNRLFQKTEPEQFKPFKNREAQYSE